MSSFANLKRESSFDKLKKSVEQVGQPASTSSKEDSRFWKPTVDKAGNGMAIIRFLPAPAVDGDDALPWVRIFKHGFQGPGGWLIDECLTTIDKQCPVCSYNSTLWNSGVEANKDIARKQKRKLNYIANILVISDPNNPENEGQIKLFEFGKKIFDKLNEAMNPEFADETPLNPFDFWVGANFKLKMRNVEGYRNYDKSEFDKPSALFDGDDDKLEALWKKEFSLAEFVDPTKFKTAEQLKQRLDKVLGVAGDVVKTKAVDTPVSSYKESVEDEDDSPFVNNVTAKSSSSDDDDDMDYFKSLAED